MKIREIISEGISPVVYHATSFKSAGSMLSSNMMRTPTGYISFTRSITGSYHKSNQMIGIIFELDGRKLNMNYKGAPVGTEHIDWDDKITYSGKDNKQLEDRLYTGEIKNLTKYITSATVYVPEEYLETNSGDEFKDESYSEQLTHAYASVHILEKLNIPHRYVTSEKELADPRANNKELFSKLVSRETNNSAKLPEKYTIKFEIYKGMGDNNIPIFDETTAVVTATSFENANLKADELTFNVATKYNVDGMAVGIVSITNQHGKVY